MGEANHLSPCACVSACGRSADGAFAQAVFSTSPSWSCRSAVHAHAPGPLPDSPRTPATVRMRVRVRVGRGTSCGRNETRTDRMQSHFGAPEAGVLMV
jgi:hypothetical protein